MPIERTSTEDGPSVVLGPSRSSRRKARAVGQDAGNGMVLQKPRPRLCIGESPGDTCQAVEAVGPGLTEWESRGRLVRSGRGERQLAPL
jgi:hypothetical protein